MLKKRSSFITVFLVEIFSYKKWVNLQELENLSEEEKNRAMHVAISIGNSQHLMASDCISSQGHVLNQGNNNYISITPDSREEADTLFNGLSEGGTIEMPMADMILGRLFWLVRR